MIISDYFFYQVGKKIVGIQATRVALLLYFTNPFYNMHLIRCFSNSVETILHLVVFNYYLEIENKLDKNLASVAFLLSIAMGIRNTSIIGWIPLLIYKMITKNALKAFLLSSVLVAVPTLLLIIGIDSIYYKQFTCTAYNFLVVNVIENRSAEFGISSCWAFIINYLPKNLEYLTVFVVIGFGYNIYLSHQKNEMPIAAIFVVFYLTIISIVPHKEERFMHPIFPYLFLMTG